MSRSAQQVLAAVREVQQTETEIALAAGISLGQVRAGLDELALDGVVVDRIEDGLRVWEINTKPAKRSQCNGGERR